MVNLSYCEQDYTDFPGIFAGETYVGEGTVFNVPIPGCAIHSRKQVPAGTYFEMRVLVPDTTSLLRIGSAKVRWCEGRQFGVEFIQMPGGDQVRLGLFVKNEGSHALPPDPARGVGMSSDNYRTSK
jgi:hypothetical protein